MEDLGIKFSKIFLKKHGKQFFQDITNQIKLECNNNCDANYIDMIFTIAFLTYIGVFDNKRICILGGISVDKNIDIEKMKEIHRKSISKNNRFSNACYFCYHYNLL